MDTFKIKVGDNKPHITATLQYADGTAIDLTSATVAFNMGNISTYANYSTGTVTVTDATAGEVEYAWDETTDTAVAGTYWGEFEITFADSTIMTIPQDHSLKIIVSEDYSASA